jgi:hypothetical protein
MRVSQHAAIAAGGRGQVQAQTRHSQFAGLPWSTQLPSLPPAGKQASQNLAPASIHAHTRTHSILMASGPLAQPCPLAKCSSENTHPKITICWAYRGLVAAHEPVAQCPRRLPSARASLVPKCAHLGWQLQVTQNSHLAHGPFWAPRCSSVTERTSSGHCSFQPVGLLTGERMLLPR